MRNFIVGPALAVAGLVLLGSPAMAFDTSRATVESRLQAVEKKTDYYKKTSRRLLKNFSRSAGGKANCESVQLTIDPKIALGGTSYAWVTATVSYQGSPINIDLNFAPIGFGFPCGKAADAPNGGGPVTIKRFCSFDVEAGDKYRLTFSTGSGNACEITDIAVELKTTNIEVVEPAF